MADDVNPYASPAELATTLPTFSPLARLRAPALGLMTLAGLTAVGGLCMLPLTFAAMPIPARLVTTKPTLEALLMIPTFIASYLILFGAWKMRLGKSYRWAYAAAVLACIPLPSPCTLLNIPFGIWALVVLHRRDVKEEFARQKEISNPVRTLAD
ncbi:MAG: hypothetical protein ACR2FY_09150 [Pirellulaceae bacterium]